MTERDNLIRTVNFEKPDHIHMTFNINASCWEHYSNDELQDLMEDHPFLFPDFKRQKGPVKVNLSPFLKSDKEFTDP